MTNETSSQVPEPDEALNSPLNLAIQGLQSIPEDKVLNQVLVTFEKTSFQLKRVTDCWILQHKDDSEGLKYYGHIGHAVHSIPDVILRLGFHEEYSESELLKKAEEISDEITKAVVAAWESLMVQHPLDAAEAP
ncbi:hypothetical protein [Neptuniibacter sp. QD37_11]|uniref:hypothetical protein n=1 Tax=Neptuniibacter sp. QD37_11 TaxID=3398209 RepID=UPI0039F57CED